MMPWITPVLAAATPSPEGLFQSILPFAVAVVALAIMGAIVIWVFRHWLRTKDGGSSQGFTLQNLRDLRDQGELTEEEYQRAREAMVGQVKSAKSKPGEQAKPNRSSGPEASGSEDPDWEARAGSGREPPTPEKPSS